MTKDRIYSWARQLQGMIKRTRELEANLDDGEAFRSVMAGTDPAKALEVAKQLTEGRTVLAKQVETTLSYSKRSSIADAEELITDLTTALAEAEARYEQWRQAKVAFGLACAEGIEAEERATLETELTRLKTRYEAAVEFAAGFVPALGVVQL